MTGFYCTPRVRLRRKMCVELLEDRQLLATLTVNTTADDASADATLSLREAIEVSSGTLAVSSLSTQQQAQVTGALGTTNTIDFDIPKTDPGYNPATGVWTIAPQSDLPTISTNAAIINGYSQLGASTNTLAQGDNAKLTIAINGGGYDGLLIAQQGSKVFGLDIGNSNDGVVITAGGNVQVAGCFIGTDPTGETAAPNHVGVLIQDSIDTIGGPGLGDRNVISGNSGGDGTGVELNDGGGISPPTGNLIENNYIGLDATGTKPLGNAGWGVFDSGSGNTVGGTAAGAGNVISGNGNAGIYATGSVTIEGNYVGTDATGSVALGNDAFPRAGGPGWLTAGISDEAIYTTTISSTISNNVVSGNVQGIVVSDNAGVASVPAPPPSQAMFEISNNLIGTNAAGTAALGNSSAGLTLLFADNATVQNNVISGNGEGLDIGGVRNVFQGNLIGTDKTGAVALGNQRDGISVDDGGDNTVGGTGSGQGNVIAFNGGDAIDVGSAQVRVIRNSIFDNVGAGISYSGGGFNGSAVPVPVLTFTPGTGSAGTLSGTLDAAPNQTFTIEIDSNPTAPPVGHQQGKTFIQDVTVNTDSTGHGSFSVTLPPGIYTALATDPTGETSAHSPECHGNHRLGGLADNGDVIVEPVSGRPAGDLHGGRQRTGARRDAGGNGELQHRRGSARARPFRSLESSAGLTRPSSRRRRSRLDSTVSRRRTAAMRVSAPVAVRCRRRL